MHVTSLHTICQTFQHLFVAQIMELHGKPHNEKSTQCVHEDLYFFAVVMTVSCFFQQLDAYIFPKLPLGLRDMTGKGYGSDGSASGSESSSEDETVFRKKVVFKKLKKNDSTAAKKAVDTQKLAYSHIKKNLVALEKQEIEANQQTSIMFDERVLYGDLNDDDSIDSELEKELWSKRELHRLARDHEKKLQRET